MDHCKNKSVWIHDTVANTHTIKDTTGLFNASLRELEVWWTQARTGEKGRGTLRNFRANN